MQGTSGPITAYLTALERDVRAIRDGRPATYIPELSKADPDRFGIAVATVDGIVYAAGDADVRFTIQSVSKPFTYAHALDRLGRDAVLAKVGVEPTGNGFADLALDRANNRPMNPMVNAGAIAVADLMEGATGHAREMTMRAALSRFAGRELELDRAVYASEKETGHRNRAIAWMMTSTGMLDKPPEEVLDLYFRQCSLLVDVRDLALMAATLANDGVQPLTGERAMARAHVPDVLSVMTMCGMYNYAGQWSYEIGLPAKSGVSGGVLLVVPGQAGIAIWSPPLDANGTSVRGIAACERIAADFGLGLFATPPSTRNVVRLDYRGDRVRSRRARPAAEHAVLAREGRRVRVVEVQDALYFGSAERLVRRLDELAARADWLILDLRRVASADEAAARLIGAAAEDLAAAGKALLLAHADPAGPLAEIGLPRFADRDAALEHVEDRLIAGAALPPSPSPTFEDLDLVAGLAADDVAAVRAVAIPVRFAAGEHLAREGEDAPLFFALASGSAAIRLRTGDGGWMRMDTVGPGMTCGEIALVERGRRSADIVAEEPVRAWAFGIEDLDTLGRERPHVLVTLIGNITRDLAQRLARAHREIRALGG